MLVIGSVAGAALLGAGYLYLNFHFRQAENQVQSELAAVAELKAGQIGAWRAGRLEDVRSVVRLLQLEREYPIQDGSASEQRVAAYLDEMRRSRGYESVAWVTDGGRVLRSSPAELPDRVLFPPGFAAGSGPVVRDIHSEFAGRLWIEFWGSVSALEDPATVGAVRIRVNAETQLFPLFSGWPLPSRTAEILLLHRDGSRLVWVADQRLQRTPTDAENRSAALLSRAAREPRFNLVGGIDRRGKRVLALARPVEGSPWVLVAKIDREEAFESLRHEVWLVAGGIAVVGLLVAAGLAQYWRRQRLQLELRRQEADRRRRAAMERLGLLLQHANDVVLILDEEMRIVEANQRAEEVYGWPSAELLKLSIRDLRALENRATVETDFRLSLDRSTLRETVHRRRDGTTFQAEISARPVQIDGRRHVLSIIRDITERKRHEQEIERLGRMYRVLSEINHVIAHRKTKSEIFSAVCTSLVRSGHFSLAWIGWHNPETREIEPVAVVGESAEGYTSQVRISSDPNVPEGKGPTGTAFREDRTYVCDDLLANQAIGPWRDHALKCRIRSSAALPIRLHGVPQGMLSVYHGEPGYFRDRELALLEEAAGDVSFAIDVLASEAQRREAEAARLASEARLTHLLTATPAVIYSLAPDVWENTFLSANVVEVLGYEPSAFLGSPNFWFEHTHPDDLPAATEAMRNIGVTGSAVREYRFRHRDGVYRWVHDECRLVRDETGKPREVVGYALDITKRKEAEQTLRASEERHRALFESMNLGVVYHNASGRTISANPAASQILGFSLEDLTAHTCVELGWFPFREDGTAFDVEEQPAYVALRTGRAVNGVVMGFVHGSDRRIRWILLDAVPEFRAGESKPHRAFSIFADITERLHDELERRKLSLTIEQSPVSILVTDLDGAIEYVNPRFTKVTGYTLDEVRGKKPGIFKSGVMKPEVYRDLWKTITEGSVWRGEIVNRKKSGELYTEMVIITPVTDARGRRTHYVAAREDITERKRAEENLRKLTRAIEQAPVSMLITDLEGNIEYANPYFTEISGYTLPEVLGRNPRIFQSGQTPCETYVEMWRTLTAGQVWRGELCNRKKNGDRHDEFIVIAPVVDDTGKATHYVAVKEDITERKRAAAALRQSREQLATAEALAHVGHWSFDLVSGKNDWSDETYRIYEFPLGSPIVFDRFLERVHPDDRERVATLEGACTPKSPWFSISHRLLLPDGRVKYVEATGALSFGTDGKPVRSVGMLQDITERKQVELQLHEFVKVLRALHAVSLAVENRGLDSANLLLRIVGQLPCALRVPLLGQAEIVLRDKRLEAGASGRRVKEISAPIMVNGANVGEVAVGYVAPPAGHPIPDFVAQESEFVESVARTIGLGLGERETFDQLRRSEERFRAIFDQAEMGMFETTLDGAITRANPCFGRLLGDEPSKWVGRHWSDILLEKQEIAGGAPSSAANEVRCRNAEGRSFWGVLTSKRELASDGSAIGHICLLQDISDQVAARETLLRFNAELEAKVAQRTAELNARNREVQGLLQANPDMILRMRNDGFVLHCQRAPGLDHLALRGCESNRDAQRCKDCAVMRESLAIGRVAVEESATLSSEAELRLRDTACTVELRAAPIGESEFVVFVRDITDRKRLEVETAAMLEKERQVSEMKTRFISVTSHEFRTPMSAMLGSVDLLRNHFDQLTPAKRSELLSRISSSIARMTDMLDDVLTLSRMDAKRTEVRPGRVEIRALMESLVEEIRDGDRGSHPLALATDAEVGTVMTDANLLRHIVSNLLSNAVRYSPAGVPVSIRVAAQGERIQITVTDQGIGIPPEDRARIFEPFERGSNVGNIKGTGLGLNIVKRMTELLGGTIAIEDAQPRGSRFIVVLPRDAAPKS
ncbi:hypothetical protein DB347_15140 [Opitutaceae bacterium EW11]|nr:hypothetical protein DB347_15140 [Opitutaceae bacterium EW11]